MVFEIEGFHSCERRGTKDWIRKQIPFLSKPNEQWLGQGYYFWTEHEYWALEWRPLRKNVVSEFLIRMPKERLLDLNSIKGQMWFLETMAEICKTLGDVITVSEVLYYLLMINSEEPEEGYFPFWATRAKDMRSKTQVPFVKKDGQLSKEKLSLVERHQLCIYPQFKNSQQVSVEFVRFVWPKNFV